MSAFFLALSSLSYVHLHSGTDFGTATEPVSMVEGFSRNSSRRSAKRCSIPIADCGSPTRRTNCTRIRIRMPRNASRLSSLRIPK